MWTIGYGKVAVLSGGAPPCSSPGPCPIQLPPHNLPSTATYHDSLAAAAHAWGELVGNLPPLPRLASPVLQLPRD